jgi:hypothetical protein
MIAIYHYATGLYFDLSPDTRISLVLNNPIFADGDIIPGDYSLPFDLPGGEASPRNAFILGHPDVPETANFTRYHAVRLEYDNNKYKNGTLVVSDASASKYPVNFKFGFAALSEEFKEKKITDICSEVITIASNAYIKGINIRARSDIFSGPFELYVNDKFYSEANTSDLAAAINADATEPRATAVYDGGTGYMLIKPYTDADDVNTEITIKLINMYLSGGQRWGIENSDFQTDYIQPIVDWLNTNFDIDSPTIDSVRFGQLDNTEYFGGKLLNTQKTTGVYQANLMTTEAYFPNRTGIMPQPRVAWILDKIAEYFNITLEGNFLELDDTAAMVLVHSNTIDFRFSWINTYADAITAETSGIPYYLCHRRSFNVNEFIPEITAPVFIKGLQKRFNLAIYYNEKSRKIRIQRRSTIWNSTEYLDLTALASPFKEPIKNIALEGVRIEALADSVDLISIDQKYEIGTPEQVITSEINISTEELEDFNFTLGNNIYQIARPYETKIPFRVGFFERVGTYNYVRTSGTTYNANIADDAVAEYRSYLRWLQRRRLFSLDMRLEMRHLMELDWEQKIAIDRKLYFWKQLNPTLTMQGLEDTKVELYSA